MIKNIGIRAGTRIAQTEEINSVEETATPQSEPTEVQSLPKINPRNTSIAAEYQMSALAFQAQLQNQLLQWQQHRMGSHQLASKDFQLNHEGETIDEGMKEAGKRADAAMEKATTGLLPGIAGEETQLATVENQVKDLINQIEKSQKEEQEIKDDVEQSQEAQSNLERSVKQAASLFDDLDYF